MVTKEKVAAMPDLDPDATEEAFFGVLRILNPLPAAMREAVLRKTWTAFKEASK